MHEEDRKFHTNVLDRAHPSQVSSSSSGFDYVRPPTSEGHNSFVRTPIWVFLDSMEIPLSQESIDMHDKDIICQTEVLDGAHPGQVSSSSSGFDYVRPLTSEGHNSFVRTPIRVL